MSRLSCFCFAVAAAALLTACQTNRSPTDLANIAASSDEVQIDRTEEELRAEPSDVSAAPIYAQADESWPGYADFSETEFDLLNPEVNATLDQINAELLITYDALNQVLEQEYELSIGVVQVRSALYAFEEAGEDPDPGILSMYQDLLAAQLDLETRRTRLDRRVSNLEADRIVYEGLVVAEKGSDENFIVRLPPPEPEPTPIEAPIVAARPSPPTPPAPPPPPPLVDEVDQEEADRLAALREYEERVRASEANDVPSNGPVDGGGAPADPDFDWDAFTGAGDGGGGPGVGWSGVDGTGGTGMQPVLDLDLDALEPAAGVSHFSDTCGRTDRGDLVCSDRKPEVCDLEWPSEATLRLVCRTDSGDLMQSEIPATETPTATVLAVARELADDAWGVWGRQVDLCLRDPKLIDAMRGDSSGLVRPCRFDDWPQLSRGIAAQAEAGVPFDTGRIGYHAPKQMVVGQPYLLELAIVPVAGGDTQTELDLQISEAVGTGTLQASAPAINLEYVSTRASERMSADLIGPQFEISGTTPREQLISVDETTVWQWLVTPTTEGQGLLNFSVSEIRQADGEDIERSVRRLPILVALKTVDSLLAEPEIPEPDRRPFMATMMTDSVGPAMPTMRLSALEPGCADIAGSDPARRALLLTNADYSEPISRLSETHPDGDRMSAALNGAGFGVRHCRDLGRRDAMRELRRFGRELKAMTDSGVKTASVFYYSGHGANVSGTNYILPTDLDGASQYDIEDGGVEFEDIFNRLTGAVATTSIVIFDACRTVMDDQSRGIVATYRPVEWAQGVIQAFATSAGDVAFDSGLYSTSLSAKIEELSAPANMVFRAVQSDIYAQTAGRQSPVYSDATVGEPFYFKRD